MGGGKLPPHQALLTYRLWGASTPMGGSYLRIKHLASNYFLRSKKPGGIILRSETPGGRLTPGAYFLRDSSIALFLHFPSSSRLAAKEQLTREGGDRRPSSWLASPRTSASRSGTSLPAVLCGSVMFRWEVVCGCKEVDLLSVCNVVREPALPFRGGGAGSRKSVTCTYTTQHIYGWLYLLLQFVCC